jgi:hypothetical protein
MKISRKFPLSVGGLIAGLAVLTSTGLARAEEPFPGALQEAAGLPCAPSCLICHTTNPGNITSWPTKPFGFFMGTNGVNKTTGEAGVKKAFEMYKADPTKAAGLARLLAGQDPDTGSELCQITYGCGAHIAKDAPRDDWSGLLFVAGAMGFGALLRRTKRR